jgi:ribose transport system ATP-binding protein
LSLAESPASVSIEAGLASLEIVGLEKAYGGELALAGVDLVVQPGEIHGLLGANGAGKSTLVRIVSGAEPPSGGSVRVFGELLHSGFASSTRQNDVAYIHQDRALAPDLTIADNIALSVGFVKRFGFVDRRGTIAQAREALKTVGLDVDPRKLVSELSIGEQTLVAIARALASSARLILLDEPTANLGTQEKQSLLNRLVSMSRQGVASLLITHSLDEALQVCHRITVLRNGFVVGTKAADQLQTDDIAEMMMGRSVRASFPNVSKSGDSGDVAAVAPATSAVAVPRLFVDQLHAPGLGPVSFSIVPGEVLGITGLADSGHLMFGEVMMGVAPLLEGSFAIDGEAYRPTNVAAARNRGIGFVPADRLRDGLASMMNLRENLFLDGVMPNGRGSRRAEVALARSILEKANVKPLNPEASLSTLSGGNMQKVLIAKWLTMKPQLLILSEPTVGVDVGARTEIYSLLEEACRQGMSVLLTSSDTEEIVRLCDRALVMRLGTVCAELTRSNISAERLTALSSSSPTNSSRPEKEDVL